ncbi:hypothetical protein ACO1O0_000231 [Amphichorda felina]
MSNLASHGRGGAGNMANATQSPKLNPSDLETPTLKKPIVTTGRGGTGNMAKNTDPAETRLRQDVAAVPRRPSSGTQHAGRGGAGNVFKAGEVEAETSKAANEKAVVDDSESSKSGDGSEKEKEKEKAKKHWLFGGKKE